LFQQRIDKGPIEGGIERHHGLAGGDEGGKLLAVDGLACDHLVGQPGERDDLRRQGMAGLL
jgi:hypothetical protein